MTARETDSDRRRVSCVGLSSTACWDEPNSLRGELLSGEALVEHARELALAYGEPTMAVPAAPLRARFTDTRERLSQAYERLHARAREPKHVPAPAEEWLLDNAHVVADQLREIHHSTDRASRTRYAVEPYVVAADVYTATGLEGRGGWTWYTGSAAWMYRVFVEHVLGLALKGGQLQIAPCIPPSWPSFEVDYRDGAGTLHIRVENPSGLSGPRGRLEVDGVLVPSGLVPLGVAGHREVRFVMLAPMAKGAAPAGRRSDSPIGKT
ncbi:MAG: hypothetical protein JNK04_10155 [Myxococcales bacterium]|nr:hypothetical protein [Myxococcales bacterium]